MDYRQRIYEKYTTTVHGLSSPPTQAEIDRWAIAYEKYLRGWLPADKDAPIVDLACGYGRLLKFLADRGYTNVLGVDISPEQVEFARRLHPQVEQGNVLDFLDRHSNRFGLITAFDLIEHFTKEEALRFLDACHKALRPGGRLIIQTLNGDTPWGLMHRYNDFTHELGFNTTSMGWVMKLVGLESFESRELGPVVHGVVSGGRWVLWKLMRLQMVLLNLAETGSAGSGVLTRMFVTSAVKPNGTQ